MAISNNYPVFISFFENVDHMEKTHSRAVNFALNIINKFNTYEPRQNPKFKYIMTLLCPLGSFLFVELETFRSKERDLFNLIELNSKKLEHYEKGIPIKDEHFEIINFTQDEFKKFYEKGYLPTLAEHYIPSKDEYNSWRSLGCKIDLAHLEYNLNGYLGFLAQTPSNNELQTAIAYLLGRKIIWKKSDGSEYTLLPQSQYKIEKLLVTSDEIESIEQTITDAEEERSNLYNTFSAMHNNMIALSAEIEKYLGEQDPALTS